VIKKIIKAQKNKILKRKQHLYNLQSS